KKRLHRHRIDFSIVNVAGVQSVEQQNSVDAFRAIAQDRANGTVARAESAEKYSAYGNPLANSGNERVERCRLAERPTVASAALTDIDHRDDQRALCRNRGMKRKP